MRKSLFLIFISIIASFGFHLIFNGKKVFLEPVGSCSKEYCPKRANCCEVRSCQFEGWKASIDKKEWMIKGRLPHCDPDGCLKCSFKVEALVVPLPFQEGRYSVHYEIY